VEAKIETLLETEDNTTLERIRPCDVQNSRKSLKIRKICGIAGITNECLRHLPRIPLVHQTHLFNHCFRLLYFPTSSKEEKLIA
jgi:hypothetical protein